MKSMNENTPSELLTQMLDGELDGGQKAEVYDYLSKDPELQAEMDELLEIRKSIQADTEAFTPPQSATNAVFNAVSINNTATVGTSLANKIWLSVSTAVVASLVTTFIILNLDNDNTPENLTQAQPLKTPFISSFAIADETNNLDVISSDDNSGIVNNTASPIQIANTSQVNSELTAPIQLISSDNAEEIAEPISSPVAELTFNTLNQSSQFSRFANANRQPSVAMPSVQYQHTQDKFRLNHGLGLTAYFKGNSPNNNLVSSGTTNNFMVGIYFAQKSNFKFGLGLGSESFEVNKSFEGIPRSSEFVAEVNTRYDFTQLNFFADNSIVPYTQLSLGNRGGQGQYASLEIGGQWLLSDAFSLGLAYNQSAFLRQTITGGTNTYSNNKNTFAFSIHYGL